MPNVRRIDKPHVYSCPEASVSEVREKAFESFTSLLAKVTPPAIINIIQLGIRHNVFSPALGTPKWPNIYWDLGSLQGALLFQSDIGWESLLCGHVRMQWHCAFRALCKPKNGACQKTIEKASNKFDRTIIHRGWILSKEIWHHRCSIVHGKTEEFYVRKEIQPLHAKVKSLYQELHQDRHFIPS